MKARRPQSLPSRRRSTDRRLELERVEDRTLMAIFVVTNNADTGNGSLRDAITKANSGSGGDLIQFNLPSNELSIKPVTALPAFSDAGTVLDGTSQPGYTSGHPVVEISGAAMPTNTPGLVLTGGNITIKGLVINGMSGAAGNGIEISSRGGDIIVGNFIGTTANGSAAGGNGGNGIFVNNVGNNTIGGTTAAERNVISGNGASGVHFFANAASRNVLQGNYIGTDSSGLVKVGNGAHGVISQAGVGNTIGGTAVGAGNLISGNNDGVLLQAAGTQTNLVAGNTIGLNATGTAALGNTFEGLTILGSGQNTIGGTSGVGRNVISGNGRAGILIQGNTSTLNIIRSNYIGVGLNGVAPFGNATEGIWNFGGVNNFIGGLNPGEGNTIANNGSLFTNDGVYVNGGSGVLVGSNSIYNNAGLGIHVSVGSNDDINVPVLSLAEAAAGLINVRGSFFGAPNANYVVQLFGNKTKDPSGSGEGQTLIPVDALNNGITVKTDAGGAGSFDTRLPLPGGVAVGDWLTATLTRTAIGDTSQFSVAQKIAVAPTTDVKVTLQPTVAQPLIQTNFDYQLLVTNQGPDASTGTSVSVDLDPTLQVVSASQVYSVVGNSLVFTTGPIAGSAFKLITITVKPTAVGSITSKATVTATEIDPGLGNNTTTNQSSVLPAVDLDVSVTGPTVGYIGSPVTYFLTGKNKGPSVASNVQIVYTVPANTTFVSAQLSGPGQVQTSVDPVTQEVTVVATVPSVQVGPSGFYNLTVIVTPNFTGTLSSTFDISGNELEVASADNEAKISTPIAPATNLSVQVDTSPAVVELNHPLTYTVTVKNFGPSDATGVQISDLLDPTLTYNSASIGGTFDAGTHTFTASLPTITVGSSFVFTITATPTVSKVVRNVATVSNTVEQNTGAVDKFTVDVPVSPLDLSIVGSVAPDPGFVGNDLVLTYDVKNNGPSAASNVVFHTTLPGSVAFSSSTPGGASVSGRDVTLNLGAMASGETRTVVLHVAPGLAGPLAITADVSAPSETESSLNNNSTTLNVPVSPADLSLSSRVDVASPVIGDLATFTLTLHNSGPAEATGIGLVDNLSGLFTIVSASSTVGIVSQTASSVSLAIPSLRSGADAVVTIVVRATSAGAVGSTASVNSTFDPVLGNNASSVSTNYINTPGLFELATTAASVSETAGSVLVTVNRTKGTLGTATVNYSTVNLTAIAGVNYVASTGTLTFADGETSKSFIVPILHDGVITRDLTFGVALSNATSASLGNATSEIVTIVNTDLDLVSPKVVSLLPVGNGRVVTSFVLGFSEALDPAFAGLASNYSLIGAGDSSIPIAGVSYDPSTYRVTLISSVPLGFNTFYRVVVNGATPTGVQDVWGNLLDGAGNGGSGVSFAGSAAVGTNFSYRDATNNQVTLKLTGGGTLSMSRFGNGDGMQLQLNGVVGRARQVLSGSVKKAGQSATGVTRIGSLTGIGAFGDVFVTMTTPPFYVPVVSGFSARSVKGLLPKPAKPAKVVKVTPKHATPAGPSVKH